MSAAAATATAPEAPKKKSKKLLFIIIGVVVLALLGAAAALFILKKNTAEDGDYADDEPAAQVAKGPKNAPVFMPLDNMVVNLADPGGSRFIQLGLTLQLQDAKTEASVKVYMPSIRSQVLLLISQRTADEMLQVQGKAKLAQDIIVAISNEMGYEVEDPEAEQANGATKKKSRTPPNPVQAVLFSSLIVQ